MRMGKSSIRYVLMETHFNNPDLKVGLTDHSGVKVYYTARLRPNDAGLFNVGPVVGDIFIPPFQDAYDISGYCSPMCTSAMTKKNKGVRSPATVLQRWARVIVWYSQEVRVFASLLHAHYAGRQIKTEIVRNGTVVETLNRNDNYDFAFQNFDFFPEEKVIKAGDLLKTTCTYRTRERPGITLGGLATNDEM